MAIRIFEMRRGTNELGVFDGLIAAGGEASFSVPAGKSWKLDTAAG